MIHPDTELRWISDGIGRGVVATRPIPKGTLVWTWCEFDITVSPERRATLSAPYEHIVSRYGSMDESGDIVLAWDHARFLNHSCRPNVLDLGRFLSVAVRDINPGDEVTCDYGEFNYRAPLQCECGYPECRGVIRAEDCLEFGAGWTALLQEAVSVADSVDQPLLPFVRDLDEWHSYLHGGRKPPTAEMSYFPGEKC